MGKIFTPTGPGLGHLSGQEWVGPEEALGDSVVSSESVPIRT